MAEKFLLNVIEIRNNIMIKDESDGFARKMGGISVIQMLILKFIRKSGV